MARIHLKEATYKSQIRNVEMSGERLTTSASNVPAVSECAEIELREYVEHVRALAELLGKYKKMIAEDCKSVRDSIDTIKDADREATWNFIGGAIHAATEAVKNVGGSN